MFFAAGILFALLFGFLHAPALFVLKAADVEIALEHDEHEHCRGEQQQPGEALEVRVQIGEVVKEFEEPHYVAGESGDNADDNRGFVIALCAVGTDGGKKYEVQHPADAHYGAHGARNLDFFRKHKDECKHKITPKKDYNSIIVIFSPNERPFCGFCALSVETAVVNRLACGIIYGENEVYGIFAAAVLEIVQPVFRQGIAAALQNAAAAEKNFARLLVCKFAAPVAADEGGVRFVCGERGDGFAVAEKAAVAVLIRPNVIICDVQRKVVLNFLGAVGLFRKGNECEKADQQSGEHQNRNAYGLRAHSSTPKGSRVRRSPAIFTE